MYQNPWLSRSEGKARAELRHQSGTTHGSHTPAACSFPGANARGHRGRGVEVSGCCIHRPVLRPPEGTVGVVWGHQAAVSMGRCSVLPRGPGACCGDVSCCVHGPVLGPPEGTLDVLWRYQAAVFAVWRSGEGLNW